MKIKRSGVVCAREVQRCSHSHLAVVPLAPTATLARKTGIKAGMESAELLNGRGQLFSEPAPGSSFSSSLCQIFLLLALFVPVAAMTGCAGLVSGGSNPPSPLTPAITAQPANQTVTAGQTATSESGATSAVVVSNMAGTATSKAATLTVNAAAVAPSITTQPASQAVTVGQTATFAVVAGGATPLTYQWRKNGTAISGATSSSYTTAATTSSDNGAQFTVVVSNSAGNVTSNAATLTVNASTTTPQFGHVAIVVE